MEDIVDRVVHKARADTSAMMKKIYHEEAERLKEEEVVRKRQDRIEDRGRCERTTYEELKLLNIAKYKAIRENDPFLYDKFDQSLFQMPEHSDLALENNKEAALFERVKFARQQDNNFKYKIIAN